MLLERNGGARTNPAIEQSSRPGAFAAAYEAEQVELRKNAALFIAPTTARDVGQDGFEQARRSLPVSLGKGEARLRLRQADAQPYLRRGAGLRTREIFHSGDRLVRELMLAGASQRIDADRVEERKNVFEGAAFDVRRDLFPRGNLDIGSG